MRYSISSTIYASADVADYNWEILIKNMLLSWAIFRLVSQVYPLFDTTVLMCRNTRKWDTKYHISHPPVFA